MKTTSKKTVTMADVADALGVTKATVSLAYTGNGRIAPSTRELVLSKAREIGFEPNLHAQRLSNGHSANMIGLFSLDLDLGVGTSKMKIIQRLLSQQGYDVPVYSYGSSGGGETTHPGALMRSLRRQKPRAIICATHGLDSTGWEELNRYQEEDGTVVCYDHETTLNCDNVIFDREHNTFLAVQHLLELGHRKIGFYNHDDRPLQGPRLQGFERALNGFGLKPRADWMFHGNLHESGIAPQVEKFLRLRTRPTAMCIMDETAAAMWLVQLQQSGVLVPHDLSIVSHDDLPIARYCAVPLSTVSQPTEEISHRVVEFLTSRLEGSNDAPRSLTVRGELIVRQSTRAIDSRRQV